MTSENDRFNSRLLVNIRVLYDQLMDTCGPTHYNSGDIFRGL